MTYIPNFAKGPTGLDNTDLFHEFLFQGIKSEDYEDKEKLIDKLLINSFLFPIRTVNPEASEFFRYALENASELGLNLDNIQFSSMRRMVKLLLQGFDNKEIQRLIPRIFSMITHYFFEKFSDDVPQLDAQYPGVLLNTHIINDYNEAMLSILQDGFSSGSDALQKLLSHDLSNIMTDAATFMNELRDRHMLNFIHKHCSGWSGDNFNALYGFFADANKSTLVCNIIATQNAQQVVDSIGRARPELENLRDWTLSNFLNREKVVSAISNNIAMPISDAFTLGSDSILTNVTFGSLTLFAADGNERYLEVVEEHQSDLQDLFVNASIIIRSLNDAGPTLEDPENTISVISKFIEELAIYDPSVREMEPREFFRFVHEVYQQNMAPSQLDSRLHLLSRFIKDSVENEYNMILSSSYSHGLPAKEKWEVFFKNLRYVAEKYSEVKSQIFPQFSYFIDDLGLFPIEKVRQFVVSNFMLYSIFGEDYDRETEHIESSSDIVDGALTYYDMFDDIKEFFEDVLKNSKQKTDVNKAVTILLDKAVKFAREKNPGGHLVKIRIHPSILSMLGFAMGEEFTRVKDMYIAYTNESIMDIMGDTHTFEKGGPLSVMADMMGGGHKGTQERVTMPSHGKMTHAEMTAVTDPFFRQPYLKTQVVRLSEKLEAILEDKDTVEVSTLDIKKVMFSLIVELITKDYKPTHGQLEGHIKLFESLITDVATNLMKNLPIKDGLDETLLSEPKGRKTSEGFTQLYSEIYGYHNPSNSDPKRDILSAIKDDPLHNSPESNIQGTIIGMIEAGSKTLTQTVSQILYVASQNPELWDSWEANNNGDWMKIIHEVLRMYPPVYATFRNVMKNGAELKSVKLNEGDLVILDLMHALNDPSRYQNPDEFSLDRPEDEYVKLPWLQPADRGCIGMVYSIVIAIEFMTRLRSQFNRVYVKGKMDERVDATRQVIGEFVLTNE